MPCLRPATPGFIVTLTATILLAIVSFNVPIIKSVYFLRASLTVDNVNGTISLGTLGYCIELSSNGTTCSSPSVGYAFDPNALLGDSISFAQIPTVVVKWITYALFLHVIALCGAAISALFGLLAHVREMSMTCCSTCISGFAAVIALVAFIFDIVLFFVVKARVKSIDGTASFGNAVWLTLAAWVMLFFSGCFYAFGRCCVRRRPRGPDGRLDDSWVGKFNNGADSHADQMRLDAVKAEADRKARQKNEVGLPAFPEHADIVRPLKDMEDESDEEARPYRDQHAIGMGVAGPRRQGSAQTYRGGYAQASPGTRAVDEYYSPSSPTRSNAGDANTGYPPGRAYSNNPRSMYNSTPPATTAAMVAGAAAYLSPGQSRHGQYPSGAAYGHASGGTSYHTAASSPHQAYPSTYSQYDPYSQTQTQPQPQQSTFNADSYNQTAAIPGAYGSSSSATPPPRQPSQPYADPYYSSSTAAQPQPQNQTYDDYSNYNTAYGNDDPFSSGANTTTANSNNNNSNNYGYGAATSAAVAYQSPLDQHQRQNSQPERSYTLGGGGYGANVVPDASGSASAYGARVVASSPPPMPSANVPSNININTAMSGVGGVMGPRSPGSASHYAQGQGQGQGRGDGQSSYEDSPPGYDASAGASVHVPAWGSKA